jgi:hypothetical protein
MAILEKNTEVAVGEHVGDDALHLDSVLLSHELLADRVRCPVWPKCKTGRRLAKGGY